MSEPDAGSRLTTPRNNLQTALLCSGIIGAVLFTTVYFCFGVISPNYFMIHESISGLQLQPYGWIQSANYIISGLFISLFAIGLYQEMGSGFGIVLIPFCHIITGLGCIILGLSLDPQIQLYAEDVTFISLITSFLLLARRFTTNPEWQRWAIYTILSVVLMIVLCILFTQSIGHRDGFTGIFERMIIGTRLVWLFFFTAKLLGSSSLTPVNVSVVESIITKGS